MKTNRLHSPHCLAGLLYTAAIVAPLAAQAQVIDYGSLQSLFVEPVTTSATGTPQRSSDVPANMTIITADQIRQAGTRNIPQVIGLYVPGIDIFQPAYAGFEVGVRGYQQSSMPRLLVLVDGRQVFVDDYSRTVWNNIPVNIDDIRQIEVVKGPASALFGSNAAGGVVNIVTYSPLFDKSNVASAFAGNSNTFGGDATVTVNGKWGGNKTSAGGFNAHEFNTASDSVIDETPSLPMRRYVSNDTVFQVTPHLQVNAEGTYSFSKQNYASATFANAGDKDTTYSLRAGFRWQSDYGTIINDNYFNRTYDDFYLTPLSGGRLPFTTNLLVDKLEDQFKLNKDNTFRIGLEYRNKYYDNTSFNNFNPWSPALEENNYAASATWLWQINDKLSWTNAVRFDHMDMKETGTLPAGSFFSYADYGHVDNAWSANSGLVYEATDADTFRLMYGRALQQPSLIESGLGLDYAFVPFGINFESTGNPKLNPTIVQNYEFNYDRKIPEIYSTAKFAVYYEQNQDLKAFFTSSDPINFNGTPSLLTTILNVGNSNGWGGELGLSGSKGPYRWDTSYSLSRVVDGPGAELLLGYNSSTPEHHFRLHGGYTWGNWEFDANGQYVTSVKMYRSNGITNDFFTESGYFAMGGRLGYNITDKFTLAASATNIHRQYIRENPYLAVEREGLITLTGRF